MEATAPAWSRKRGEYHAGELTRGAGVVPYAELHAHSAFSFLDGASPPEELVEEAVRLGLEAIAVTDHDGFYGVVRFAEAAREWGGMRTVFGAELSLDSVPRTGTADPGGTHLLVLARGQEGYRRLSREIAAAHLAGGEKGKLQYDYDVLTEAAGGHWQILTGCRKGHVRQALTSGGREAAADAWGGIWSSVSGGRSECRWNSLIMGWRRTTSAMPFWPNWRESMDYVRWRPPPRTSPLLRVDASPWQWRLCGRVKAWTRQQDGWPLPAERTCGPARRWRHCSRSIPRLSVVPPILVVSALSISSSSRPNCHRSTCQPGIPSVVVA